MIDPIEKVRLEARAMQQDMLAPEPEYEEGEAEHDYILVRSRPDLMQSRGGIFMPSVEDPTGNQRAMGWYEVMSVGPGPWTDRVDSNNQFMRRPMCCDVGDLIIFQGRTFGFNVPGEGAYEAIQNYQVTYVRRRKS